MVVATSVGFLRVLLVVDFYKPFIGGMERYVESLAHYLNARGHHVAVVTVRHGSAAEVESEADITVYRVEGLQAHLPVRYSGARQTPVPFPDPVLRRSLESVIATEQPDIIVTQGWMSYSVMAADRRGARLIMTLHDYGLVCARKVYLRRGTVCTGPSVLRCLQCAPGQFGWPKGVALALGLRAFRRLHRRVDQFVAVSGAVRDASAPGLVMPVRPIEVIPAFVDDDCSDLAAKIPRPEYLPQHDYLLFVGSLHPHKGVPQLLEAHARLRNRLPLVLLGVPGVSLPPLEDDVIVRTNVPHDEVLAALYHATVGVVPSQWAEPFSIVTVEAMACGCPVVASDIGGLRDLVNHGVTGLKVPVNDIGALSAAIDRLREDRELRDRMSVASRERSVTFTASQVGARLEELYRQVLARDRQP
jgi:glycosyltransferase involved in cell wall biosynthesis